MIKRLKRLSVVAVIGMMFVLIGGALVTKTGSEAGCGASWPLCNGQFLPTNITPELVIELSHRLVSGVIGIVVLFLVILAWRYLGHVREVKLLSFLSLFFLVLQALIGAAAVKWGQSDFILAMHFGISLISFTAIFLLMLIIFEIDKKLDTTNLFIQKKHRIELYTLTIYTLMVVYTGALVRHTKASLVCADWPFCANGSPLNIAGYDSFQWIQMGHRLAAGILLIWTLILSFRLIRYYRSSPVIVWGMRILSVLILLQATFGALIIFTMLNTGVALSHAFVISCYFAVLSYFVMLSTRHASIRNAEQKH